MNTRSNKNKDVEPNENKTDCQNKFRNLLETFVLSNEDINDSTLNSNVCLISQEPLEKQHINLPCGHKFNYRHLYDEVARQKYNLFRFERPRLGDTQIKCPYCQTIHNFLLPPCRGYEHCHKVNSPIKWSLDTNKCTHVFARGKNVGRRCDSVALCGEDRCLRHSPKTVAE